MVSLWLVGIKDIIKSCWIQYLLDSYYRCGLLDTRTASSLDFPVVNDKSGIEKIQHCKEP